MVPAYDPPYESPIEDCFAWNIVKYLNSQVRFDKQVEAETVCGVFRIDFTASLGPLTIGFECDGEEFHGRFGSLRDEWRDAVILAGGSAQVIYRLRGKDLFRHMDDCLSCVARCDPRLFSDRGIKNLDGLVSEPTRRILAVQDDSSTPEHCTYVGYPEACHEYGIRVERRTMDSPYFRTWLDYIAAHGGGSLDTLMGAWWEGVKRKTVP